MAIYCDIQTYVKNISGSTIFVSFLPPHGKSLTANQTVTFEGNLFNYWPRATQKRWRTAYDNAVANGIIDVRVNTRQIFAGTVTNSGSVGTIAAGDMVWWDSVAGSIRPATDTAAGAALTNTLQSFANVFLGIAIDAHTNAAATVNTFRVDISPNSIYEVTTVSETHNVGDLLCLTGNAGSKLITSNSTFNKTSTASEAIARAMRKDGTATTTAMAQLESAFYGANSAAQI